MEKEDNRTMEDIAEAMNSPSKHFVLIHGAGHGAWCWFKLRPLLEASGNKVNCFDLAGAGIDLTDISFIHSFHDYNKPLLDFMSGLPEGNKVVLVGHSAGGLSLIHALNNFADKIEVAIFIAATMLPSGFCSEEDAKDGIPDISEYGDVYELKYSFGSDKPPTCGILRKDFQRKLLYQLSPIEDSALASMLIRPASFLAFKTAKFEGTDIDNMNKVRRVYIRTNYDNMLKPEQQDKMIGRWPPHKVFRMDTDHSPFFSAPRQLCEIIISACNSII